MSALSRRHLTTLPARAALAGAGPGRGQRARTVLLPRRQADRLRAQRGQAAQPRRRRGDLRDLPGGRAGGARRRLARRVGRATAPQWTRNP